MKEAPLPEIEAWHESVAAARTVAFAALLGSLLGPERELAGKPAGLRTHILVAVSASLLVLLGGVSIERLSVAMAVALGWGGLATLVTVGVLVVLLLLGRLEGALARWRKGG